MKIHDKIQMTRSFSAKSRILTPPRTKTYYYTPTLLSFKAKISLNFKNDFKGRVFSGNFRQLKFEFRIFQNNQKSLEGQRMNLQQNSNFQSNLRYFTKKKHFFRVTI